MARLYIICLLALVLMPYGNAESAEPPIIFVLFARGWAPYEMNDETGSSGISLDLFHKVMPPGVPLEIEPVSRPRSRLYAAVPTRTYTRLEVKKWFPSGQNLLWSDPVVHLHDILISPAARPVSYEGPESLEGKVIGCIRNYYYPIMEPLFSTGQATRYDVNKDIILLRMVQAGRVDGAVINRRTARWIIRNTSDLHLADFHFAQNPVDKADLRFVFNRTPRSKKWLPDINTRIRQIQRDGVLEGIFSKYD